MGVVLNPIAYRMGYKFSWFDAWFTHRSTYSMFVHHIFKIKLLITFIFYRYFYYKLLNWMFSHTNVYIFNNKIFVNIFLYDTNERSYKLHKLLVFYRYIPWNEVLIISEWFKYQILDRRKLLKRFFNFTRATRFFFDLFNFANIGPLLNWNNTYRKLKRLKRKKLGRPHIIIKNFIRYNKKYGKVFTKDNKVKILRSLHKIKKTRSQWIAREELIIFRRSFYKMTRKLNGFALKWWIYHYNLYYSNKKSLRAKKEKFKELKNVFRNEQAKSNIKIFIIFCSFLNKFLVKYNRIFPARNFAYRSLRKFLKFFFFFFVKKKMLFVLKNFLEYVLIYINSYVNIKFFIFGNKTITANFLARFLANGFRKRISYLNLIKPILKNLNRLLATKYKGSKKDFKILFRKKRLNKIIKTFKYDLIYLKQLIKNKRYFITNKIRELFLSSKLNVIKFFGLIAIKSNYDYFKLIIFENINLYDLLNENKKDNNIYMFSTYFSLINWKNKFKTFYYYKYFSHYNSLKKKFAQNYLTYKLNSYFENFFHFLILIKNKYKYVYNIFLLSSTTKIKLKKYYFNFILLNLNINSFKKNLLKTKRKDLKIYIENLFNYYSWYCINSYIIYIINKNIYNFVDFNPEYYNISAYYARILKYRNLNIYKNYYIKLNKIYNNIYERNKKKLNKVIRSFRNQIINIQYISYYEKYIYEHHIELAEINEKWFNARNIWYKKVKFFFKKHVYNKFNYKKYNINLLKKKYLIEKHNLYKFNSEKNMYIYIYFFSNFFLFIIIKLFSLYLFKYNNSFNLVSNNIKIIYHYFYYNLLKIKYFLCNYKDNLIKPKIFNIITITDYYIFSKNNFYYDYSRKFFFSIKGYKKHLIELNKLYSFNIKKHIYDRKLIDSPISTKKNRMQYFLKYNRLYGYKFHFTGRFTRKQKSANLWFSKGYLEVSSAISRIDYAFVSVVLRFSVCSVKVWLYKSNTFPTYRYSVFF
jgi:hypothetical protein